MSTVHKAIYVVAGLYLLRGVPNLVPHFARHRPPSPVAVVYLLCVALGICRCFMRRKPDSKIARWLVLVTLGIPSLVFASQGFRIGFPTYVHLPLTFGTNSPNGQITRAGIDLIPAVLFVLMWTRSTNEQFPGRTPSPRSDPPEDRLL